MRLNTGQEVAWSGPPSTKISNMKQFVEEKEGIAPERQRWLFGGQLLPDAQTLEKTFESAQLAPHKAGLESICRKADALVLQVMVRPQD